jgi:hypothetical protein
MEIDQITIGAQPRSEWTTMHLSGEPPRHLAQSFLAE